MFFHHIIDNTDRNLREGTGKSAERGVMGSVDLPPKEYLPYHESLRLAKEHQPWEDSTDPSPAFAKKLRASVLGAMTKLPESLHKNLKFYTAVGSPFDQYHGVDALFEFEIIGKEPVRVTLDVTMKPGKPDWKADVLFSIGNIDIETFSEEVSGGKFDDVIGRVAGSVASIIISRLAGRPTEKVFVPKKIQPHG